jgi:hypothetical protein
LVELSLAGGEGWLGQAVVDAGETVVGLGHFGVELDGALVGLCGSGEVTLALEELA